MRIILINNKNTQYSPVSGTVEEVNESLGDQPGLINKSPEDKGIYLIS